MPHPLVRIVAPVALAILVTGCTASPTTTTVAPSPASTLAGASATAEATVPALVYFPRDTSGGVRLAREERAVQSSDPLAGAIETMLAGPRDPDYLQGWAAGTRLLGVTTVNAVTTVDLSAQARTTVLGSEGSAALVEQLIWTVTEITGAQDAVALTIEGQPAGELWGVVSWDGPRTRGEQFSTRALVAIDSPLDGDGVASPVTVRGDAAAYEALLEWRVRDSSGSVVQEGTTHTAEGQTFALYTFDVELAPGTYKVEVSEVDTSGGEGRAPDSDDRTIVVEGV